MAMEEKQHAGMLQHCREAGVFAAELPDNDQIQRLNALFRLLEARLAEPQLALDDAFDLAIELESSEINIVNGAHVMRKKMELPLAGHFDRLSEAASKFHVSPEIRTRHGGRYIGCHPNPANCGTTSHVVDDHNCLKAEALLSNPQELGRTEIIFNVGRRYMHELPPADTFTLCVIPRV